MLPRKLMLRCGVRRSAVVPASNPLRSVSKPNGFIEIRFARSWRHVFDDTPGIGAVSEHYSDC